MNNVMLIGRLARDPELKYTQSGSAVTSFTLAVSRRFANQNGEREADFINCVAWQKSAEFVANYFKKGQSMAVEGRLQVRSCDDKDGQKRYVTEVVVYQVEFVGSKNARTGETTGADRFEAVQDMYGEEITFDDKDLPF